MKINNYIDYTMLKATTTYNDIYNLCKEALEKECASVCIPSHFVKFAKNLFPTLTVCTVVGFPLGNSTIETKVEETHKAIEDGADEIDMVMNISEFKNGNFWYVADEIETISKELYGNTILKVIIETCYLSKDEIVIATELVDKSSANFVKTSTGFGSGGATFEDVILMKNSIKGDTKIKASGGIRTKEEMMKYIALGCDRIGASKLP